MGDRLSRRFAEICTAEPPTEARILLRRAVVLGGSVAGLFAARVLSDHAEEVVILERDELDTADVSGARPGAPQGLQVHALLQAGRIQLDRWFPGFSAELVEAGATMGAGDATVTYVDGVRKSPPPDVSNLCSSRLLLEGHLRRRVLGLDNVRAVRGRADGLIISAGKVGGVRHVRVESTGDAAADGGAVKAASASGQVLEADFVVDAMGRSSRLSDWLEQAGWPRPAMRRMQVDLNYATAVFRRGDELPTMTSAVSFQTPQSTFSRTTAAMVSVEGGRRMVVLAGYSDNRPSRDPEEFRRQCCEQPREFAEIAERCEMIGPILTYRQADSRRRDFHKLDRLPGGLVAAGDAVSSFNPVYGQGMTSGALHASCLSEYLRSGASPTAPARSYFADVRIVVDAAWQTSTLADLGLPHVTGPYPRGYRIMTWLSGLVANASVTDAEINRQLMQVTNMLVHPNALATPGMLLRSVRAVRGQARNKSATTVAAAG